MSEDNKIYKSGIFDFEISAYQQNNTSTNVVFSTQDTGGTAKLVFNLKKENGDLPLSSATSPKLIMAMSDGSRYIVNPSISDGLSGQAVYSLTDDELTHSGKVQCELYVAYPNQNMQIHKFGFTIDKALIDSDITPIITYYVQTWNEWEAYFQTQMNEMQNELDDLQAQADTQQQQFDNLDPTQFLPKSGGTMTGALQFDGVPTIFQSKQNSVWWYRLTSENSTTYQQSLYPTIVSGINGVQGVGYNFKQTYLRLNNVDVETVAGSQAKADKALADAKADSQAKANQALVDANIYTDNSSKETVVWSGSSYFLDTHIFSWDATKVKHGVLLEFSRYTPGTGVLDYGYIQYFFSKEYLVRNNNKATWVNMPGSTEAAKKTIRLTPTSVSGDATNGQAPSTNYALRTVSFF